jgi:hypothetical protein
VTIGTFAVPCLSPSGARAGPFEVGLGTMTCSYWLSTPELEGEGDAWLLGFWTGMNMVNRADRTIGVQTDGDNILRMIKHDCRETPTWLLVDVATNAYRDMYRRVHGVAMP